MNETNFQLEGVVMRRVRFIYYARLLARPIVLEGFVFLGTAVAIALSVSIPDVISNFYHLEMMHYSSYFTDAFLGTEFAVQATLVLVVASGAFLLRDSFRNFRAWRNLRVA